VAPLADKRGTPKQQRAHSPASPERGKRGVNLSCREKSPQQRSNRRSAPQERIYPGKTQGDWEKVRPFPAFVAGPTSCLLPKDGRKQKEEEENSTYRRGDYHLSTRRVQRHSGWQ